MSKADIIEKTEKWIDNNKVRKALNGFQAKKSPGPDDIKPNCLKHLPNNIISLITFLYRSAVAQAYTPKKWSQAKVIFIPKPGKENYNTPKAFRPITLSNYLLKGLERLVVWNMDEKIQTHPLHTMQHGFRTDRSTETAISNTTNYIEKAMEEKKYCVGVFLDIQAAFDSMYTTHIKNQLIKFGAEDFVAEWYFNYISTRKIAIKLQKEIVEKEISVGFPQGGVASAKFWLIAFDEAVKIINRFGINGNAFADDCGLILADKNQEVLIRKLQHVINDLVNWGKTCGLHEEGGNTILTGRLNGGPIVGDNLGGCAT
jgi:hypothetical protein